jgi:hypothetical protein
VTSSDPTEEEITVSTIQAGEAERITADHRAGDPHASTCSTTS